MLYRLLGRSGLRVSEISLGAMTFGENWGFGANKDESRSMLELYASRGGNFINTANKYTEGASEEFIGEFLAESRDSFVIATKFALSTDDDPNAHGHHRKNARRALEASLRRLRTDHIDLYLIHAWDYMTPVEEIMRVLDDFVREGKVLYVGISNTPAWIVAQANTLADLRGWSRFVGLEIEYSLTERSVERELLPMARAFDIGVLGWAPLAGGILTGKYVANPGGAHAADSRRAAILGGRVTPFKMKIAEEVKKIAGELGWTPAQVALNWVRAKPGNIIPIVGARKVAQLEDTLGAIDLVLEEEHVKRLDEVSQIPMGFPFELMSDPFIQQAFWGPFRDLIENHRG